MEYNIIKVGNAHNIYDTSNKTFVFEKNKECLTNIDHGYIGAKKFAIIVTNIVPSVKYPLMIKYCFYIEKLSVSNYHRNLSFISEIFSMNHIYCKNIGSAMTNISFYN